MTRHSLMLGQLRLFSMVCSPMLRIRLALRASMLRIRRACLWCDARGYASLTPAKFKRHSVALVDAPFGRVFCGRFTSLGCFNSGVTHFRPGMRLLYTANGLRHSHQSVSPSDSRRKPQRFKTFWERMLSRSVSAITPLTRGSRNAHVKNSLTVSVI